MTNIIFIGCMILTITASQKKKQKKKKKKKKKNKLTASILKQDQNKEGFFLISFLPDQYKTCTVFSGNIFVKQQTDKYHTNK